MSKPWGPSQLVKDPDKLTHGLVALDPMDRSFRYFFPLMEKIFTDFYSAADQQYTNPSQQSTNVTIFDLFTTIKYNEMSVDEMIKTIHSHLATLTWRGMNERSSGSVEKHLQNAMTQLTWIDQFLNDPEDTSRKIRQGILIGANLAMGMRELGPDHLARMDQSSDEFLILANRACQESLIYFTHSRNQSLTFDFFGPGRADFSKTEPHELIEFLRGGFDAFARVAMMMHDEDPYYDASFQLMQEQAQAYYRTNPDQLKDLLKHYEHGKNVVDLIGTQNGAMAPHLPLSDRFFADAVMMMDEDDRREVFLAAKNQYLKNPHVAHVVSQMDLNDHMSDALAPARGMKKI